MLLISKVTFENHYNKKGDLLIDNIDLKKYEGSSYKFRAFGIKKNGDSIPIPDVGVMLEPGERIVVTTKEVFKLSERVLGIFGQATDLFLKGFQLIHSPFIDPKFEGILELVLKNDHSEPLQINKNDIIGKVVFFDVSESLLSEKDMDDYSERWAMRRIQGENTKKLVESQNE